MSINESQFETGRREINKQDFHRIGNYRSDNSYFSRRSKKFEFSNSVETTESKERIIFKINLSQISRENLKIIPSDYYIIVQSNKKTIFIKPDNKLNLNTISTSIKGDILIIEVKK